MMRPYPCCVNWTELEEAPKVDIVGAFDVHRKQITFDYVQIDSGEVHRGKIRPADRESLREWLDGYTQRFSGKQIAIAVEATTGWRYVVEEMKRARIEPHLAEPAETKSLQGPKKRAKTDRLDAGHLRDLMMIDRLPESWIPPDHVQEIRTLTRLRHNLIEERTTHKQRIHAQLFHNGHPQQKNHGLHGRPRPAGRGGASGCSPAGGGPLLADDRPHKRGARARRGTAQGLRSSTGQLPGAHGTPRRRGAYQRGAVFGTWRHQTLLKLEEGGTLRRPRRHRPQLRRQTGGGQAQQAGSAGFEMGGLRGGEGSLEEELARSRVLPRQQGAHRGEPGVSVCRPQADPPGAPYLTGTGRGGYERASIRQ